MTAMNRLAPPAMRGVLERYAALVARLGSELGDRPLVLPTAKFFPDAFGKDQRSALRLVRRMQRHAGMTDIPIAVDLVGGDESTAQGGCGTGGCGTSGCAVPEADEPVPRLIDEGGAWRMNLPVAELEHSVVLTANIARALGYIFLVETREESEALVEPVDVTADLAAVALGFGALLLEGSYIYSKSCGGPKVARVTRLTCPELAVAFSAFVVRGGHRLRSALHELGTTQRALVEESHPWLDANRDVAEALRSSPERIAARAYELEEPRPWLLRLFGKSQRAAAHDGDIELEELEAMVSALPAAPVAARARRSDPRREELRELVDEAMAEARNGAE
jgi:hypothetical protein